MWSSGAAIFATGLCALLAFKPVRSLLHFVFLMLAIKLEGIAAHYMLSAFTRLLFPRNEAELMADPTSFFRLLQAQNALPAEAIFVGIRSLGKLEAEPDKNSTSCAVALTWERGGEGKDADEKEETPMFVKFQCGRGLPLWMQAARGVLEPGVAREVEFYRQLSAQMPVRVAKPFFALSRPSYNRICIVAEFLEGSVTADWQGASFAQVQAIVRGMAKFHGKFWHCDTPAWIRAKAGIDYAGFVTGFSKSEPEWFKELWAALCAHFATHTVTLVHGDCRPGNMMWLQDAGAAEPLDLTDEAQAEKAIVFNDWEAVTVAPSLWDFVYCTTLGQEPGARRERAEKLLDAYLAALAEGGAELSLEDARLDVTLLTLVLYFVSAVVAKGKFWSKQGNTTEDGQAWQRRVAEAVREVSFEGAVRDALEPHGIKESHFKELKALVTGPKLA